MKKFRVKILVILVFCIFPFVLGALYFRSTPKHSKLLSSKTTVLYAQRQNIHLWKNGIDSYIANNPAGYESCDTWIGYSKTLKGIVFDRLTSSLNGDFMLMEYDYSSTQLGSAQKTGIQADGSCADLLLVNDEVQHIRIKPGKVELWSRPRNQNWKMLKSWSVTLLPPISGEYPSRPSKAKGWIAFDTEDNQIITIRESDGKVIKFVDGYEPTLSPDGKFLAYVKYMKDAPFNPGILCVAQIGSGKVTEYVLWSSFDVYSMTHLLGYIATLQWTPHTGIIACEVMPAESGTSYIYLLEPSSGKVGVMPFMVERGQWCVF
jgi:hypothetical protein